MSEPVESTEYEGRSHRSLAIVAAAGMVTWLVLEFAFRRGLGPRLADVLDSGLAAEGTIMIVVIPVVATIVAWIGTRGGIDRVDWEYDLSARSLAVGFGGIWAYYVVYLALVVAFTAVLAVDPLAATEGGAAADVPTWAIVLYFVGNGVVVPISEELAWRGVIQTALTEAYGTYVAVAVTALAFVGKHLVVDLAAPPLRVTSLLVLAFVFCGLRARWGTASATVAHVGVNLLATASFLLAVL